MAGLKIHGSTHQPYGTDPVMPGPWIYPATFAETVWDSGTTYSTGDKVSDSGGVFNWIAKQPSTGTEPGSGFHWPWFWRVDVPLLQNGWNTGIFGDASAMPLRHAFTIGVQNELFGIDTDTETLQSLPFELVADRPGPLRLSRIRVAL